MTTSFTPIKKKYAMKSLFRSYYSSGMRNVAIYIGLLMALYRAHKNTQTGTTLRHLNPVKSHYTDRRYILISASYLRLGHRSGSCSMRFTDPNVVITFNPTHVAYSEYPSNQSWQYYVPTNYGVPHYLTFFTMNIRSGFGSLYKRPNAATNTLHSHHNSHDMAAI
jgi:hypothetical protein